MDSAILTSLVGLAGTFGGIFLGNWLARDNSRKEREEMQREREKERQNVYHNLRTLLSVENQQNLDALTTFWASVHELELRIPYSPAAQEFEAERKFATLPMPQWGQVIWTANVSRLADTLNGEQEIRECYRLHTNLLKFTALHQAMLDELEWIENSGHKGVNNKFDAWKRTVRLSGQASTDDWASSVDFFREHSRPLWSSITLLHEEIKMHGNPIKSDVTPE